MANIIDIVFMKPSVDGTQADRMRIPAAANAMGKVVHNMEQAMDEDEGDELEFIAAAHALIIVDAALTAMEEDDASDLHEQQAAASSSKQHSSSSSCTAAARSRRGRRLAVPSSTLFQDEVFLNITPHTVSAHYTLGCGGFLRVDGCSETPSQLALEYETMRWAGLSCGFPGKIIINDNFG